MLLDRLSHLDIFGNLVNWIVFNFGCMNFNCRFTELIIIFVRDYNRSDFIIVWNLDNFFVIFFRFFDILVLLNYDNSIVFNVIVVLSGSFAFVFLSRLAGF